MITHEDCGATYEMMNDVESKVCEEYLGKYKVGGFINVTIRLDAKKNIKAFNQL